MKVVLVAARIWEMLSEGQLDYRKVPDNPNTIVYLRVSMGPNTKWVQPVSWGGYGDDSGAY